MKKLINPFLGVLIAILILGTSQTATAQLSGKALKKHLKVKAKSFKKKSVELSADTIFKTGIPYAILTKDKVGGMPIGYSISALNGVQVLYVSLTEDYAEFKPLEDTRESAYMIYFANARNTAKMVVKHDLITPETLNLETYRVFQIKFSTKPRPDVATPTTETTTVIVNNNGGGTGNARPEQADRKRDGHLYIFSSEIKQGTTEIGSFKKERERHDGESQVVWYIYHLDGTLCAKFHKDVFNDEIITVLTQWDNQRRVITQEKFDSDSFKKAIQFLIDNLYL